MGKIRQLRIERDQQLYFQVYDSKYPLYCFDLGAYTYKNQVFGCHPGIWLKINSSHKISYQIKAELIIFLLH